MWVGPFLSQPLLLPFLIRVPGGSRWREASTSWRSTRELPTAVSAGAPIRPVHDDYPCCGRDPGPRAASTRPLQLLFWTQLFSLSWWNNGCRLLIWKCLHLCRQKLCLLNALHLSVTDSDSCNFHLKRLKYTKLSMVACPTRTMWSYDINKAPPLTTGSEFFFGKLHL